MPTEPFEDAAKEAAEVEEPGESKGEAVDDVKGLGSRAKFPDPVKGAGGNLLSASKARNL